MIKTSRWWISSKGLNVLFFFMPSFCVHELLLSLYIFVFPDTNNISDTTDQTERLCSSPSFGYGFSESVLQWSTWFVCKSEKRHSGLKCKGYRWKQGGTFVVVRVGHQVNLEHLRHVFEQLDNFWITEKNSTCIFWCICINYCICMWWGFNLNCGRNQNWDT